MADAKSSETKTTAAATAAAGDPGLSFKLPGDTDEPETVTATFGEEGEDPLAVGFVGTKPKD